MMLCDHEWIDITKIEDLPLHTRICMRCKKTRATRIYPTLDGKEIEVKESSYNSS
jgi:hypothetical protein